MLMVTRVGAKTRETQSIHSSKKETIMKCFFKYMGDDESTSNPGKLLSYLSRETSPVVSLTPTGSVAACMRLIDGMLNNYHRNGGGNRDQALPARVLERLFLHALVWTVGGALEGDDRRKFDEYLRAQENSPVITVGNSDEVGEDDDDLLCPRKVIKSKN